MQREHVSEDVYVFTSELYAQVTAGAVVGPDGAVIIDTLPFPSETAAILDFVNNRLGLPVRYLIYTHYHADHTNGAYLFKGAEGVGHALCREILHTRGRQALDQARAQTPELANAEIVLPDTVFAHGTIEVYTGRKAIQLTHSPGHSPDSVTALVKEDHILFAGDTVMPLPHIVDGDWEAMRRSLEVIPRLGLENIVQGHGEVILRGEIDDLIKSNIKYLDAIRRKVEQVIRRQKPRSALREVDIQDCGKSRIPLGGQVTQLHTANLLALYDRLAN